MAAENKTVPDGGWGAASDAPPSSNDGFQDVLKQLAGDPADVPLPPQSTIGHYVVEQELGSGGFGTVYRCRDPIIGKVVAIKVLRRQFSLDPIGAERFLEEARAAARIGHDGIIDVFGVGTLPDQRRYLVMEYIEGHTLRELMTTRDAAALSLDDKLVILEQVAQTLDAAHEAGVVHRDVKPANVFVSRTSRYPLRTKLLDFGIAKRLDDEAPQRTSGQILGTPAYMSPEQCEGLTVTPAADIYSLGVMAFELLTGMRPLLASSATALRAAHLREKPPQASQVSASLPRGVDSPLRAMLAKDPEARPHSASKSIAEIRAALASAKQRASRRRVAVAVGAAATLVGGLALLNFQHAAAVAPAAAVHAVATISTPQTASASETEPAAQPAIVIRVVNAPAGATLRDDSGAEFDVTAPIRMERRSTPLRLTLSAPAHRPEQLAIVPDRDQELDGRLEPSPPAHPASTHKKHSSELEY